MFTAEAGDWLEVEAIEFETMIVGKEESEPRRGDRGATYRLSVELLRKQARFGAAGNSEIRRTGNAKYRTTTVGRYQIAKEGWSIAGTEDLKVQRSGGQRGREADELFGSGAGAAQIETGEPGAGARIEDPAPLGVVRELR